MQTLHFIKNLQKLVDNTKENHAAKCIKIMYIQNYALHGTVAGYNKSFSLHTYSYVLTSAQ